MAGGCLIERCCLKPLPDPELDKDTARPWSDHLVDAPHSSLTIGLDLFPGQRCPGNFSFSQIPSPALCLFTPVPLLKRKTHEWTSQCQKERTRLKGTLLYIQCNGMRVAETLYESIESLLQTGFSTTQEA